MAREGGGARTREPLKSAEGVKTLAAITDGEDDMGELIDKVKGKIKKVAGNVSGNNKLKREGDVDSAKGKVKGAVEDAKHAVKEVVKPPPQ